MTFPYPLNIRECDSERELVETLHRYEARLMELRQATNKRLGEIAKFKVGDIIKQQGSGFVYRIERHSCSNTYGDKAMTYYNKNAVIYIMRRYILSRAQFVNSNLWYSGAYMDQFKLIDDPVILDKIKKGQPIK